ncbi:MAG: hypothetical protein CSA62_05485 [Planctomycetota bacterium]|nr:MAG: hypothetical protein CSA62_05485 [Planctomycetota bacterium]
MCSLRPQFLLALLALLLFSAAPASAQGREDFAEGVRLLRSGDSSAALAKLKDAEAAYGGEEPATLLQNLAVAAWRSGQIVAAEAYAERAAARDPKLNVLRDNILGAAKLAQGKQAMASKALDKAEKLAERSVAAFESALTAAPGRRELRRNLARALKLQEEIEEEKKRAKQKKENKKKDKKGKDGKKQDQSKQDTGKQDPKSGQDKSGQDKKETQESKDSEKQQGEKKGSEEKQSKDKPGEKQQGKQNQAKAAEKQQGAKAAPELSEEEKMRLLQRLQQILQEAQRKRSGAKRHRPGKRDW